MSTVGRQARDAVSAPTLRAGLARTAARAAGLVAVAVFLANLHLPWRPPTLDLLRGLTGIPCPFCGTTTAFVRAGQLDLLGAFAANPFIMLGALAVITAPLTGLTQRVELLSNRGRVLLAVALLAMAEVWQLVRFGLLG
ncbi:MAG: DUF2752 domain-containing protein [Streptosporangiales bacterium]